eukprot:g8143.t1
MGHATGGSVRKGSKRVVGVDMVRGLAMLGMVMNHEAFQSIDFADLLEFNTLSKVMFGVIGGPLVLLSGFRGVFMLVSMTIFGYLHAPAFLRSK